MAWFRIDDQLPKNRKARSLTKGHPEKKRDASPFGLWALAGAWSNDGFVPADILDDWDDDWEEQADRLVAVGLWHHFVKDGEAGYVFHDWEDQNPTTVNDPSGAGIYGNHVKHHVNKGGYSESCIHCTRSDSQATLAGETAATRGEGSRVSLPPVPPVPTRPSSASADAEREFDDWWALYPRKKGKGQAAKAYRAARKKTEAKTLADAVTRQAEALMAKGIDYCPYPATWLNGERWDDQPDNVHPLRRDEQGQPVLPPPPGPSPWSSM